MKKKKITVSVISDITTDQRMIRICNTLFEMGFDVLLIGRCFRNSLPLDQYSFKAVRIKCLFRKGVLQYAEFNIRLLFKLLFSRTSYLLSNDLDTLAPNYFISLIRRKKIVYDTHEYFTGVPELKNSPFKRRIWKKIEDVIFPKLKTVYTVNNIVKEKYQSEYGNDIKVIRNVPATSNVPSKSLPQNWENKIILLMQGSGINYGRGGIELLEAMKYLPANYHLVFVGSGNQWNLIKQKKNEWDLNHCVEMIERMPPSQLKSITPLAHLGFSLDNFEDLNCLFNLPNKIFDYIHAGVPIIATGIPEVKSIIEQYQCGICLNSQDPVEIANSVKNLMHNQDLYLRLKQNTRIAARELCWENEKHKLIAIYEKFL